MSQFITWPANKSLVTRVPASGGTRTGCGKNERLYVGRDGDYVYTSYTQFDQDWSQVTDGSRIIAATLVLTTDDGQGGKFPIYTKAGQTPRIRVRRLKSTSAGAFTEGNNASEHFDTSDADNPEFSTADTFTRSMTKAGNYITNLNVTAMVEDMAPSRVKRRDGTAGGKQTNHGFGFYAYSKDKDDQWSGWSRFADTPAYKPYILLEFEPGHTKPHTPTNMSPSGSVLSIGAFQADFGDDRADKLKASSVQLYGASDVKSGNADTDDTIDVTNHGYQKNDEVWFHSLTGGAGLSESRRYYVHSVVNDNSFRVKTALDGAVVNVTTAYSALTVAKPSWSRLGVTASDTEVINGRSNVTPDGFTPKTGVTYKWRIRQTDDEDQTSAWCGLVSFSVSNTDPNAPTLTPANGTSVSNLLNVMFRGGTFSDPDGDSLAAYQCQLSAYGPGSPNWDVADNVKWDTGKVYVPFGSTDWETEYTGQGLAAGTYYWRARHWDDKDGVSPWAYASITTGGFEQLPGQQTDIQMAPNVPWRIVIKEMKFNAVGGALTGVRSTGLFTTASNHGLTAGQKVRFGTLTGPTGIFPDRDYWVMSSGLTPKTFRVSETDGGTSVHNTVWTAGNVTAGSITAVTTRGPGKVVAIFEHARSVGASIVWNSPGELHFTCLTDDPQAPYVEPKQTHYSVQFYQGDGWREGYAGLVWDADINENDIVYTCIDYLAALDTIKDERYFPEDPDKSYANGGSYYSNKTIRTVVVDQLKRAISLPDSPVGFISIGSIATMNEMVSIYSTMEPTLSFIAGLLDSHRQGTGKRTRIEVKRTSSGAYQFVVTDDPGVERSNLRLAYGELVQGYRIILFGRDWASVTHGVGRTRDGVRVLYKTAKAPGIDQKVWGRIARVVMMDNVADEKDAERRVKQAAITGGKLGKALGVAIRSGVLSPRYGHDVCDYIPVVIRHGPLDTTRLGSGYWSILAEAWEAGDDASQNLILTLSPREDATPPSDDLLQSAGNTSVQAEWQIGWKAPNPLEASSRYWLDQSTGKVWVRNYAPAFGTRSFNAAEATDTFTSVAHGLNAGDCIVFRTLDPTTQTGLFTSVPYYVSPTGLTADTFKVTDDGVTDIDVLLDVTTGTFDIVAKFVTGTA